MPDDGPTPRPSRRLLFLDTRPPERCSGRGRRSRSGLEPGPDLPVNGVVAGDEDLEAAGSSGLFVVGAGRVTPTGLIVLTAPTAAAPAPNTEPR